MNTVARIRAQAWGSALAVAGALVLGAGGAMAAGRAASAPAPAPADPPVDFNHLYVTLEQTTIDSIGASGLLAEQFSAPDVRKVTTTSESWTGTYLMGWRGYLELFGPGGFTGTKPGACGLAFNPRRPGTLPRLLARLRPLAGDSIVTESQVAQIAGETIPWFDGAGFKSLGDASPLAVFVTDFRREYLEKRGAKLTPEGRVDRHEYVAARFRDRGDPKLMDAVVFDDFTEVEVDASRAEAAAFHRFALAMGWRQVAPPPVRRYQGNGLTFVVTTSAAPGYRIRRVVCSLRRDIGAGADVAFGPDARLSLEGTRAVWEFGPR